MSPARFRARHVTRVLAVTASIAFALLVARPLGSYLPGAGRELSQAHLGWLAAAVAAELVSVGAFAQLQRAMLGAGGTHVSGRRMLGLALESNAFSGSLPAGAAVAAGYTFRRFRSWGATAPAAGFAVVVSGLLSALAFGVLAAVDASAAGSRSAGPMTSVVVAILLAAAALGLRHLARRPAASAHLADRGAALLNRFRRRTPGSTGSPVPALFAGADDIHPTACIWSSALFYASINWVADLACLMAAGRAVGAGSITIATGAVAYIAGMSVSGISLTPGGLGIVEAAMIFTLGSTGSPHAEAVASVVLYRVVSYLLLVAIGWAVWLIRILRAEPNYAQASERGRRQTSAGFA